MGVSLKSLVPVHVTSFKDLKGCKLGVDSFNWLYQFLSIIRQPDGTPLMDSKGRVTSHLTGLFYRTSRLLEEGLRPCYVFDGKPPSFKLVTAARIERREKARKEYEAAKARGDYKTALSKASQSSRLTKVMIDDSKKLLEAMGVPIIQAPSEGEAQAAFMVGNGDLYAAATQDYDAFLFGAPRVVRNLNVTGRRRLGGRYVIVSPELVLMSEVLEQNELSREELIMLGILMGTDYNPGGVKGIGPKKGLKLIKEFGVSAWKHVEWDWKVNPEDILKFFLKPPVTKDYKLEWKPVNPKKVKALLVTEYEFNEDRVDNTLSKVVKVTSQSGLNSFF